MKCLSLFKKNYDYKAVFFDVKDQTMFKKINTLYFLVFISILNSCTIGEKTEKTISAEPNIRISLCPNLAPSVLFPEVSLQNYTYTRGRAMFSPVGIRLGGKTSGAENKGSQISRKGTHLHLNIDNRRHYLSNSNNFEYPVENGIYKFFAFISRSYYESIKNPDAIIAKKIEIRNGQLVKSKDLENVDIIYNAPRGIYKNEDSEKIVLDFLIVNTEVSEGGNTVRVTIDGKKVATLDKWQACYIEGAEAGEHTVLLELLNEGGQLIAAQVSDTFTVIKD